MASWVPSLIPLARRWRSGRNFPKSNHLRGANGRRPGGTRLGDGKGPGAWGLMLRCTRYNDGMTNSDKTVLIAGATGRQGGALIRHLRPKGWKLRALTRKTDSYASQELARQGVELVQGDLEDPGSLERAARGVYGIYSVQDYWAVGARREVVQGKNLADAAKKAGVQHFVYGSVGGAERNSGIPHWESKWEIEKYIRQLGLPATILRPVSFMETYHVLEVEVGILK